MAQPRTRIDRETGEVTRTKKGPCPCGKILYTSRKLALEAMHRQRREWGDTTIRPYHSYPCHGYHLGHPTPRQDREVA
jgi:hypothetical protein